MRHLADPVLPQVTAHGRQGVAAGRLLLLTHVRPTLLKDYARRPAVPRRPALPDPERPGPQAHRGRDRAGNHRAHHSARASQAGSPAGAAQAEAQAGDPAQAGQGDDAQADAAAAQAGTATGRRPAADAFGA
ncbi:hypothetical protein CBM2585_A130615 [Cupriavidus taiwanensis]|nr:hypothetical protein CBM2585_A130615 [Cupriavidus taiwanensis]